MKINQVEVKETYAEIAFVLPSASVGQKHLKEFLEKWREDSPDKRRLLSTKELYAVKVGSSESNSPIVYIVKSKEIDVEGADLCFDNLEMLATGLVVPKASWHEQEVVGQDKTKTVTRERCETVMVPTVAVVFKFYGWDRKLEYVGPLGPVKDPLSRGMFGGL